MIDVLELRSVFWPVLCALLLSGCAKKNAPRNLVLVSVDTLRADHLSAYGSKDVSTPHFDRIAREGVLFENASTVAPTTLPAHASLLTGVSPETHRVHDNVGFRLREDLPTLASTLKTAGYRTGGFVGAFVLDARFGLARGFDVYSDDVPASERGFRERRGDAVLDDALRFIESGDGPFFAFVHFFDPHRPYDPPTPFHPGVADERASYRGEVAYVDSLLGTLRERLEASGLLDSTVLVVTADHGESLGEHGEDTHGLFLYQSTLHVPLVIRGPSVPAGVRIPEVARVTDVLPTALELVGVEPPAGIEGVSFLTFAGEIRRHEVEAYAETYLPRLHYGWSELRSLRRGNWKLVLAPRSELYELGADPAEERNVAASEPGVLEELRVELARRKSVAIAPGHVDEGTLASLRALGYLGSAAPSLEERERADPKDRVEVYREILALSVEREATDEVLRRLEAVLAGDPENPRSIQMYGNFLLDRGRPERAREAFARLPSDSFDGLYGQGRALQELGEDASAKVLFESALEIDPRAPSVLARLAEIEKKAGNVDAAERRLREAIVLEPDSTVYRELADLLLSSGREAELARLSGTWRGPDADAAAAYARGQLLVSGGNLEGALVELERALRLAPGDDNVQQVLANTLSRIGRFAEAEGHYQEIVRRTPCYLGALSNLGAVHERLGRIQDAIRSYERAIACDRSYGTAYANLGRLMAQMGELARALELLQEASRLDPSDRELAEAVVELESMVR